MVNEGKFMATIRDSIAVIIKYFSNSVEVKILPSKGRLSRGRQHIACYVVWAALLSAVALIQCWG